MASLTSSTGTWTTSPAGANSMELILNDLSIHKQFADPAEFREAIERVQRMREAARRFSRELHCHRETVNRMVNPTTPVHLQIQSTFSQDEKRSLMTWLTKQGPFWNEVPRHDPSEWFECNGQVVTETALAEAAYSSMIGFQQVVVSLTPSVFEYTPIAVKWVREKLSRMNIDVSNYWEFHRLETALRAAEPPIESWLQLEYVTRNRFERLTFARDCFDDLEGRPFNVAAAKAIASRLDVLNRLVEMLDDAGHETPEFNMLFQNNFVGDGSRFSDSSDTEKSQFRTQLTFRHPNLPGESIFCPMHGKVNQQLLRIHFSWPIRADRNLFVVYVGRKITTP